MRSFQTFALRVAGWVTWLMTVGPAYTTQALLNGVIDCYGSRRCQRLNHMEVQEEETMGEAEEAMVEEEQGDEVVESLQGVRGGAMWEIVYARAAADGGAGEKGEYGGGRREGSSETISGG